MSITDVYCVKGNISDYVSENILQTNNKPFTLPIEEFTDEKQTAAAKTEYNPLKSYDPFKSDNIKLPDWMWTKAEAARSDEEILKDVEELARECARTGQPRGSEKFYELMKEYISPVSPDRAEVLEKSVPEIKGIVKLQDIIKLQDNSYTMTEIYRQIDSQRMTETDEKNKEKKELIDYLIEVLGNNRKGKIDILQYKGENGAQNLIIKSDMYEARVQDGEVKYAEFFYDGKSVMAYEDERLVLSMTQQEVLRKAEFGAVYDAAYDFAIGKHTKTTRPIVSDPSENELIDMHNKTYNSVYARLKNDSLKT